MESSQGVHLANFCMSEEYYKTLGIGYGASSQEIKRAYRKLAKKYHPDVNSSRDASKRFTKITKAYNALLKFSKTSQKRTEPSNHSNPNPTAEQRKRQGQDKKQRVHESKTNSGFSENDSKWQQEHRQAKKEWQQKERLRVTKKWYQSPKVEKNKNSAKSSSSSGSFFTSPWWYITIAIWLIWKFSSN